MTTESTTEVPRAPVELDVRPDEYDRIGIWLSAALEDENVCFEMKADIEDFFLRIERDRKLIMGDCVRIPTSGDEAALMVLLGTEYLQKNAPHKLTMPPNSDVTGIAPVQEI